MKFMITEVVLVIAILCKLGVGKTFPNDFKDNVNQFNHSFANCTEIKKFSGEFRPCEKLVSGALVDKLEKVGNYLVDAIKSKNMSKVIESMDTFCQASNKTVVCINDMDHKCINETNFGTVDQYIRFHILNNPVYIANNGSCDDSGVFAKALSGKAASQKLETCLKDHGISKINEEIYRVIKFLKDNKDQINNREPGLVSGRRVPTNGTTPGPVTKNDTTPALLKAICDHRTSVLKVINVLMTDCDNDLRKYFLEMGQLIIPKEAGGLCKLPKMDVKVKINRLEKKRISMFMFGGMHYYGRAGNRSNGIVTCSTPPKNAMIMMDTVKMQVKCTVHGRGESYTFLTNCTIIFDGIDEIEISGNKMPTGFKKSKGLLIKGKGEGKGDSKAPDFDIKITRKSDMKMVISDRNSGIVLAFKIFVTVHKDTVLGINLRVPESLMTVGTGAFIEKCANVVDKTKTVEKVSKVNGVAASLRFKREPTNDDINTAGQYDAKGLDDDKAASLGAEAVVEETELVTLDKVMSTSEANLTTVSPTTKTTKGNVNIVKTSNALLLAVVISAFGRIFY